jgi:hypothetical protein
MTDVHTRNCYALSHERSAQRWKPVSGRTNDTQLVRLARRASRYFDRTFRTLFLNCPKTCDIDLCRFNERALEEVLRTTGSFSLLPSDSISGKSSRRAKSRRGWFPGTGSTCPRGIWSFLARRSHDELWNLRVGHSHHLPPIRW